MASRYPVLVVALGVVFGTSLACTNPPPTPTQPASVMVSSITPSEGLAGVPIEVKITGTGLVANAVVTLGGYATDVSVHTGTSGPFIIATTPRNSSAGLTDVVVTNPNGQSGTLTAGFRYNAVTLTVSANSIAPGGTLSVHWVAPGRSPANGDWIGLFRLGDPNKTPVWTQDTTGASGTITLNAPADPGAYEFRYLVEGDSIIDVARSSTITVTAAPHTPQF
jgi:hypothetical protein